MGWIIWILTYALGSEAHTWAFNPWFITLCFFIGNIKFTYKKGN